MQTRDDLLVEARRYFADEEWADAASLLAALDDRGGLDPETTLYHGIALLRLGDDQRALKIISPDLIRATNGRHIVRKLAVAPLLREKRFAAAEELLTVLIAADPESVADLISLGSVLTRLGRRHDARSAFDRAGELQPANLSVAASRIQMRLQAGEAVEAAALALTYEQGWSRDMRVAHVALLALSRIGDSASALRLAAALDVDEIATVDLAVAAARAMIAGGACERAMDVCDAAFSRGLESALLRWTKAQLLLKQPGGRAAAIEQLTIASELDPDNLQANQLLGELLLRSGRAQSAAALLGKGVASAPELANARALHARALKMLGRYDEAANELLHVVALNPDTHRWNRYATAALVQAGRIDEASALFAKDVSARSAMLPDSFEDGLNELWTRADGVGLPNARLDWAWALGTSSESSCATGRLEWERAAKWGHLADHFMLDWLECFPTRADEAMACFADLTPVDAFLSEAMSAGRGLLLASAHVGPMYAGPLALELLGIKAKWLASTPSVSSMPYTNSLISTSDQTDAQVARKALRALRQGDALTIAVDGAMNPATPRIAFEGQEITYSDFAARAAFKTGAQSVFSAPMWDNGKIKFVLEPLPEPVFNELLGDYAERWRLAYLGCLRQYLMGDPTNLRLSGGLWRHLR